MRVPHDDYSATYKETGILIALNPRLTSEGLASPIKVEEMSPGEQLEFLMLLWAYDKTDRKLKKAGAILLLDEPDAHLHPSLVKNLIETIQTKLIDSYGLQVIMTTHNATTVSLVPDRCLYVMTEDAMTKHVTIAPASTKKQAIQLLTSKFVYVNQPFRLVFVEASNDVIFYNIVKAQLTSRLKKFATKPQILFISHGQKNIAKDAKETEDSSCERVVRFVEKLCGDNEDTSLKEYIFGLLDQDDGKPPAHPNLRTLGRYSIENYIFDPLHVFFALLDPRSKNPEFAAVLESVLKNFKEHGIEDAPSSLQHIMGMKDIAKRNKALQIIIDCMSDALRIHLLKRINSKNKSEKNNKSEAFFESVLKVFKEHGIEGEVSSLQQIMGMKDIAKRNKELQKIIAHMSDALGSHPLKRIKNKSENKNEKNNKSEALKKADLDKLVKNQVFDPEKNTINLALQEVVLLEGARLQYSQFLLRTKGHILVELYGGLFFYGENGNSNEKSNMAFMLEWCKNNMLIPKELSGTFEYLQDFYVSADDITQESARSARDEKDKNEWQKKEETYKNEKKKAEEKSSRQAKALKDLQEKNKALKTHSTSSWSSVTSLTQLIRNRNPSKIKSFELEDLVVRSHTPLINLPDSPPLKELKEKKKGRPTPATAAGTASKLTAGLAAATGAGIAKIAAAATTGIAASAASSAIEETKTAIGTASPKA